jgi:two-component system, NtrC family, response regulator AtoC
MSPPSSLLLVIMAPTGHVTRHPLPQRGEVVVGRGAAADVRIDHPSVSRRHASLAIDAGVTVTDLGSVNGTRIAPRDARDERTVGNTSATGPRRALARGEAMPLRPGDVLELGAATAVLLEGEGPPARRAAAGHPVVAVGATMRSLLALAERVAGSEISVLLRGETGVGKEVFARLLHALSPRAAKPFLAVNCAELTGTLLESELFGHERGAFTGALGAKPGLFESAHEGTVFLDEVGELPPPVQARLLRVLEVREVRRLGSVRPRTIDVRFVAATNRDLEADVATGAFRQDLYFRLDGFPLTIPPLRERLDELEALARHFTAAAARGPAPDLAPEALARLRAHAWPGNVRELRNVIERAVLLCGEGPISADHLPAILGASPMEIAPRGATSVGGLLEAPIRETTLDLTRTGSFKEQVRALERERMRAALKAAGGVQVRAAELMGMPLRTFKYKLKVYELDAASLRRRA